MMNEAESGRTDVDASERNTRFHREVIAFYAFGAFMLLGVAMIGIDALFQYG